jgi:hypothetical protein
VFVNLIQTIPTAVLNLPLFPVPSNIAVLFVQDLNGALGEENVYINQAIQATCTSLSVNYIYVGCSYAYYTSGAIAYNYGFGVLPWTPPAQYTTTGVTTTVANPLSPFQALVAIANNPSISFPSGTQNIVIILTTHRPRTPHWQFVL